MATKRPVICPVCGAKVRKNGYCSGCYLEFNVARKAYNTSNYYYNIAYDKSLARDLSGAIDALKYSLRYNKRNVNSRNLLGLIYYEMGEIVNALSEWVVSVNYQSDGNIAARYLKELKGDPTRLDTVNQIARKYNMALGYAQRGDYDLALLQLKSVLSDNPHFVKGYLFLALIYMETANYEKARKALKRALKIDKANPLAIRYLYEMGDNDENIIKLRMDEINDDEYMEEEMPTDVTIGLDGATEGKKNNKIFKEFTVKKKDNTVRLGEFGEVGFARYSGIYVLMGIVIGALILAFVILPGQKKKYRDENAELLENYSEELTTKEAEVTKLSNTVSSLKAQIAQMEKEAEMASNPMPDYSQVESGMSDEDFENLILNE
jgi:tetratricopeptide (TPR) repeat protein